MHWKTENSVNGYTTSFSKLSYCTSFKTVKTRVGVYSDRPGVSQCLHLPVMSSRSQGDLHLDASLLPDGGYSKWQTFIDFHKLANLKKISKSRWHELQEDFLISKK